ncbi:MAG: nickel ABC transporter permease [Anaerolineae bacterium]
MSTYLVRRLFHAILVLWLVSVAVFAMLHLVPGDPVEMLAFESGTGADMEAMRERLGLNDPLPVQYLRFAGNALQGDLGRSIRSNRPVTEEFFSRFPNTATLAFLALGLALLIGIPAGVISAVKPNSVLDYFSMFVAVIGVSMPVFWLGLLLLLVFSLRLEWLPMSGFTTWKHMILPTITLSMFSMASVARLTRSSFLEVMREDYVRTARAKGLSGWRILSVHALRNSLIPVVTIAGLQFGQLLGGAVITEIVFAIPGVGRLVVDGITARDFPIVQGSVLYLSVSFVFVNLLVDVLYTYIDPRIRYA